jgi:hypothetical protein
MIIFEEQKTKPRKLIKLTSFLIHIWETMSFNPGSDINCLEACRRFPR